MMTKVLLVEDDAGAAAEVADMLSSGGHSEFEVERAQSIAEARQMLAGSRFDAVLLDFGAHAERFAGLADLVAVAATLPVVVLTQQDNESQAAAALQAGAQDYLVKQRINGDALRRVIRYSRERIRAQLVERELRDSRHRIQAITDHLVEGVLVVGRDGVVVFSNRSARTLLQDNGDDQLADRHIDSVLTLAEGKDAKPFADGPLRRVIETGEVYRNDDAVFQTADGRSLVVALACSPLIDGGRCMGAVISFRDIEELKRAQREALQASKLASVGQLAAGIAHEINTPTQYIGDNLRFIGDALPVLSAQVSRWRALAEAGAPPTPEALHELLQSMDAADLDYLMSELPAAVSQSLEGVGQVSRIVLAMKEFSHPGEREKTPVNLNRAVENTLAVSRNEWKHVAEIELDLDAGLPDVLCHPGEINQVLLNLIINAAHAVAVAHPGAKGRIAIATRQRGDWADIVVVDDGTGMSDEVRERIFDPFFTTKEVGKGTGQGLAICRDVVVNKHSGRITVDSREGQGATFTVSLPISGDTAGTTVAA